MKTALKLFLGLSIAGILVYGCSNESDDATPNSETNETSLSTAKVQFFLTDAPGDYAEVIIDVQEVSMKQDSGSWAPVEGFDPINIDLLQLTNGENEFLGELDLDSGAFGEIRLILGSNNRLLLEGDSVYTELKVPSGSQSGLKIKLDDKLVGGASYSLTLDFDVAKSVVQAGNSGKYNLKPVIRALLEQTDNSNEPQFASISGAVSPALQAVVFAILDGDSVSSYSDSTGSYLIQGLSPGAYDLYSEAMMDSTLVSASGAIQLDSTGIYYADTLHLQ